MAKKKKEKESNEQIFEVDGEEYELKEEDEITGGDVDELVSLGYLQNDGDVNLEKQKQWNATLLSICFGGLDVDSAKEIPFKTRNKMLAAAREILGFTEEEDTNFRGDNS